MLSEINLIHLSFNAELKWYHLSLKNDYTNKPSFSSFFGNLPPNISGELTKNEDLMIVTNGINNSVKDVSLLSDVKMSRLYGGNNYW